MKAMNFFLSAVAAATISLLQPDPAAAQGTTTVTPDTYIRAETDRSFQGIAQQAGGVNQFYIFRNVAPLDNQTIVRMNKDTLYSMAVVDTEGGATITVPEIPDGRYASVYLVDNDHYVPLVIYEPGVFDLPQDTKYLGVGVRIQVFNPDDPAEIKLVNDLQDQFIIDAKSADPLPEFKWEVKSLNALKAQYEKDSADYSSYSGMQGPRGTVNEEIRHIAAAAGWGLFPDEDAIYLNYYSGFDADQCYRATYQVPDNDAFWSITVYGDSGYLESENAIINASNVALNDDGSFTTYFGTRADCGDVANRLDTTDNWNFLMRIYRPGASVLDGSYELPKATRYLRDMVENYIAEYPNQEQVKMMTAWLQDNEPGKFIFTGLVDPEDTTVVTPQATVNYGYNWFSLSDGPAIIQTPQYDKFFSVSIFDMLHNIPAVITNPDLPTLLIRPGQPMPMGEFNIVELETDQGLAFTRMVVVDNLDEVMELSKSIVMDGGDGDMTRAVYPFSPEIEKSALGIIEAAKNLINPDVAFGKISGDVGDISLAAGVMLGQLGTPTDTARYGPILTDENGKPLNGTDTYVLTVPAGLVEDSGYMSVTVYGAENQLLIPNDQKRYDRTSFTAEPNADGTYTITLSPSGEGMNGIPTGKPFYAVLRAYVPVPGADMSVNVQTQ
jgi:hypothetical protein